LCEWQSAISKVLATAVRFVVGPSHHANPIARGPDTSLVTIGC
jgi:hypothetical protein